MTTFNEALAEHGSAKEAIKIALYREWQHHPSDAVLTSFEAAAQWVLDNAAAIAAHQHGIHARALDQRVRDLETNEASAEARVAELAERITAVVRDVALLKDERILGYDDSVTLDTARDFSETAFGTEPQTAEARKLFGLDVATPDPEPVYEWVGNDYYFDGNAVGGVCQIFNGNWLGHAHDGYTTQTYEPTESEARSWVEAQFNTPK